MNNSHAELKRRGFHLGSVNLATASKHETSDLGLWRDGKAILLRGICEEALEQHQADLRQTKGLYMAILDQHQCDELLAQAPYAKRLSPQFESLGSTINEGDDQEIETVLFDAVNTNSSGNEKPHAEDLWIKVSWLSFYEHDASMRFRFSFGVDHVEDVAADHVRQHYASELTDAVFPESRVITQNQDLTAQLKTSLNIDSVKFVERIVYFNSPDGGAYLHHDRERGHAGVVYAQLSGATYWLALPKHALVSEISMFIHACMANNKWPSTLNPSMQNELIGLTTQTDAIADQLDTFANNTLIHLINETQPFIQQLIEHGFGQAVNTGDVLWLPQESDQNCCWHSVFNLGDESGQALSFALRTD